MAPVRVPRTAPLAHPDRDILGLETKLNMAGSLLGWLTAVLHALGAVLGAGASSHAGSAFHGVPIVRAPHGITYFVDGTSRRGQCRNSYTRAEAERTTTPWCNISTAVARAAPASTIEVVSGTYHESVVLSSTDDRIALVGVGPSRPVITGDGRRAAGIVLDHARGVTIKGFELESFVASPVSRAAGIISLDTANDTITDNVIHAVHGAGAYSYGIVLGTNAHPGLVHDVTVAGNHIFDIGPGGESIGIWLLYATRMRVQDNEIYLVRKEGIRDWGGFDNAITSNRVYLDWAGIALEESVGDAVTNNIAYANVWALNPKHVSDSVSLRVWRLHRPAWTRFSHNTTYANTHADLGLGQNPPPQDYIRVDHNVFTDPGDVHIHDFPGIRGPHVLLDNNVYAGTAPIYYAGWHIPHAAVRASLAAVRAALGWDRHSALMTHNPHTGDLQVALSQIAHTAKASSAAAGAADVPPASMSWTRYPTTAIASTPEPEYLKTPTGSSDGRDDSIWWSSNYGTNASVTFDLSAPKPINTFVLDLYQHLDPRSPKRFSIQVSDHNTSYRTVLSGSNPDDEGSSYKYTLTSPVTARYVRFNALTNFGASTLLFSDFGIGLLAPT